MLTEADIVDGRTVHTFYGDLDQWGRREPRACACLMGVDHERVFCITMSEETED